MTGKTNCITDVFGTTGRVIAGGTINIGSGAGTKTFTLNLNNLKPRHTCWLMIKTTEQVRTFSSMSIALQNGKGTVMFNSISQSSVYLLAGNDWMGLFTSNKASDTLTITAYRMNESSVGTFYYRIYELD